MTKEDYMQLPKERLAELLAERDKYSIIPQYKGTFCPFGGSCTNIFRDCINCPGVIYNGEPTVTTSHTYSSLQSNNKMN